MAEFVQSEMKVVEIGKSVGPMMISNDIKSPCNIKKCTTETIASCCGCPEWFKWKYDIEQSDKRNPRQAYVGKHLKRTEELEK